MAENIRCEQCGTVVYGLVLEDEPPKPVQGEECPKCGGTEFTPIEGEEEESLTNS